MFGPTLGDELYLSPATLGAWTRQLPENCKRQLMQVSVNIMIGKSKKSLLLGNQKTMLFRNVSLPLEKHSLEFFLFSLERRRLEFSQRHLLHRLSLPLWPLLGFLLIDFQHRVQKRLMKCNVIDMSHNMMGWQRTGILFFDQISISQMVQTSFCAASFY